MGASRHNSSHDTEGNEHHRRTDDTAGPAGWPGRRGPYGCGRRTAGRCGRHRCRAGPGRNAARPTGVTRSCGRASSGRRRKPRRRERRRGGFTPGGRHSGPRNAGRSARPPAPQPEREQGGGSRENRGRDGRRGRRDRGRGGGDREQRGAASRASRAKSARRSSARVCWTSCPRATASSARSGYLPRDPDVYVSMSQVRRYGLRRGDLLEGQVRAPKDTEKYPALQLDTVNGVDPELSRAQPPLFEHAHAGVPGRASEAGERQSMTRRRASSTWSPPSARASAG